MDLRPGGINYVALDERGLLRPSFLGEVEQATLPENRQSPEARQAPENGQSTLAARAARIGAINRAGVLMGRAKLAGAMGQSERTMRAYASAEIAMPDAVLTGAAGALEREARAFLDHAAKLRELANSGGGK